MDASQFKALFLPCTDRLYASALRLEGNRQAAEDLVQDTLLRLWTQRDSMPPHLLPAAYAMATLRHLYCDRMRRGEPAEADLVPEQLTLTDKAQEESADNGRITQDVETVKTIMSHLPASQRMVMTLHDIEQLDNEEISQLTGLKENNIRVLLHRARSTVRKEFHRIKRLSD